MAVRRHLNKELVLRKIKRREKTVKLGVKRLGELPPLRIDQSHTGEIAIGHERVIEDGNLFTPLACARQKRRKGEAHVQLLKVGAGIESKRIHDMPVQIVNLLLEIGRA